MAFISLGEALDRVLEKLAVERREKEAGGVETARQLARGGVAQGNKPGCDAGAPAPIALRQRQGTQTLAGARRPVGRLVKG